MREIRVLIVDDSAACREGLRLILERLANIRVVGESADGESAVHQAMLLQPDVVLMDVQMPGINGIEATRRLKSKAPQIPVICLTAYPDALDEALAAGASRFILKDSHPSEIAAAVCRAADAVSP